MLADAFGNLLTVIGIALGCFMLVLFPASLFWLYTDAEARGKTGCLWLLIAFFTWPFGILAYLVVRDRTVQL